MNLFCSHLTATLNLLPLGVVGTRHAVSACFDVMTRFSDAARSVPTSGCSFSVVTTPVLASQWGLLPSRGTEAHSVLLLKASLAPCGRVGEGSAWSVWFGPHSFFTTSAGWILLTFHILWLMVRRVMATTMRMARMR